ncbi:MAG: ABC transporter substrate-binding protein, partial [Vicingaceae bacterium]
LNSKAVRQAINLGFNRRDMVKYLRNNIGKPAEEGFIPSGLPPFKDNWISGFTYNPDSARALLRLAGYPSGQGMKPIKLTTTSNYLTLCEFIQSQLSEIGIPIVIELNPAATSRELVALSKAAFFRKSWVADYPDAENYLSLFYSGNFTPDGPNYTHFKDVEYDKLYELSRIELDQSRRFEYYKRMEEIILDQAVIVPLYYDRVVHYTKPQVSGLSTNAMNVLDLKKVRVLK